MTKKLILICDGTAQGLMDDNNMSMLAAFLQQDKDQHVWYDPGVGTLGSSLRRAWDSLTGKGLWTNVIDAYTFLMNEYKEGDQIYLFGYSRGAATVRILIDVIQKIGLLQRGSDNLLPYLWEAYNNSDESEALKMHTLSYTPMIAYVGVEDTVFQWGTSRVGHCKVIQKCLVDKVHHHIAMDERRKAFPLTNWRTSISNYQVNEFAMEETHTSIAYSDNSLAGFMWNSGLALTMLGKSF